MAKKKTKKEEVRGYLRKVPHTRRRVRVHPQLRKKPSKHILRLIAIISLGVFFLALFTVLYDVIETKKWIVLGISVVIIVIFLITKVLSWKIFKTKILKQFE